MNKRLITVLYLVVIVLILVPVKARANEKDRVGYDEETKMLKISGNLVNSDMEKIRGLRDKVVHV